MSSITSEDLHKMGFRPDGRGGLIRMPAAEWDANHAATHSGQDFDNGGVEAIDTQPCILADAPAGKSLGAGGDREAHRAVNAAPYPLGRGGNVPPVVNSRPQIRLPKRRAPNRTENLYQGEARRRWPECELRYEAFAFILPSGCRYVPDWTAWRGAELVAVVEVKGGYLHPNSTRSIHAWKEASAAWPAVRFVFAQWKDGEWNETEVLPK